MRAEAAPVGTSPPPGRIRDASAPLSQLGRNSDAAVTQSVPLDEVAKNVVSEAKEGGGHPQKLPTQGHLNPNLSLSGIGAIYLSYLALSRL